MRGSSLLAEDIAAVVAARLAQMITARTVYTYAVPEGYLPERYLLVTANAGETSSGNVAGLADQRMSSVDVTSVAADADRAAAAREALWGSRQAVDALTDYRPTVGRATWRVEHLASYAPRVDESLPEPVMVAVERFTLAYQP